MATINQVKVSNTTYDIMPAGGGYGTCATAAATTAKVVTLSGYILVTGGIVSVKFTYSVPANATMNINSKGAKSIYYRGKAIVAGVIAAGDIVTFIYDGTRYNVIAIDRDNDTVYEEVTATTAGLMSIADKIKLDRFDYSATAGFSIDDAFSAKRALAVGNKDGEYFAKVNLSTATKSGSLAAQDGTFGLYDSSKNKWLIYSDVNGNIILPNDIALSGATTCNSTLTVASTLTAHAGIKSGNAIWLGDGRFDFNGSQSYSFYPSNAEVNYGYFHGVREAMWGHSPYGNGTVALGFPNYRWGQVYSTQATISTSDRNAKKEIAPLSEKHLEFFALLQPVSFQFIDSNSGRTHVGFISQDVEEAMNKCGLTSLDFAGFCRDQKEILVTKTKEEKRVNEKTGEEEIIEVQYDESVPIEGEYIYSLRYEEFIALNTMAIQHVLKEQKELKKQIAELAKKFEALES